MKRRSLPTLLSSLLLLALTACSLGGATAGGSSSETAAPATATTPATPAAEDGEDAVVRPAGWTDATHSNAVDPNYAVVFPQDKVNQITIRIDPDDWAAMQANMTDLFGEAGTGGPGGGGGPGQFAPGGDMAGGNPPAGGPGGGGDFTTENPMWVAATLEFEGQTWTNVGVRYKGNSSLMSAWNSGSLKLPLKLDFDEWEAEYPAVTNQRFYGFKELSLGTSFSDASYLREAVAYDLLADAGLTAAETAYYEVILDYGQGPVNLGLYTAVEVIDDTVVERVFGEDSGNLYEGDGAGVSLAAGTLDQITASFQKENNAEAADWSDLEALYNALHAETRTTDPAAWRAQLEAVFNVDAFLEWLALSAVIQNWDTYGQMTHNFYLYNDPDTGQLTWISWDHNMVLGVGGGRPGGGGGPGGRGNVSLDKAEVGENWPLIRYLLDDPTYSERYRGYLEALATGVFDADQLAAQYQQMAALIEPYVDDVAAFQAAVQSLTETTYAREAALAEFLAAR